MSLFSWSLVLLVAGTVRAGVPTPSDDAWPEWRGQYPIVEGTVSDVTIVRNCVAIVTVVAIDGARTSLRIPVCMSIGFVPPEVGDFFLAAALLDPERDPSALLVMDYFQSIDTSRGPVLADQARQPVASVNCLHGAQPAIKPPEFGPDGLPLGPWAPRTKPWANETLLGQALPWHAGVAAIRSCTNPR